jgi:translation initiation factor 2-alpha kinase 4
MSTSLFEHSSSEDASSGVGTRLYMSPEQENPALAAGLTDKCDMYALGIVFFEMWFPFSTGHERIDVLTKLRSKLAFPEGFERSHPRQVRIIRWLLSPEASKRPSAFELLHHNLLPPKLEDEQFRDALRALANPHATFYRQLLDHLFLTSLKSQKRSELVTSERIHLPTALNFVSMEIQNIFEVHFANAIKTPTLITATKSGEAMPEKEELEEDSGVDFGDMIGDHEADMVLMNRKGTLFKLRFSLRESLDVLKTRKGRYQSVRTYEIGPVFRQSPVAGDPREYFQADFDIPFASPLSFAECIVVLEDVLNQIGVSKRADYSNVIRIGHHIVTRGIFEFCGINDNDSRKAILRLINDPNVTRSALQSLMLNSKTCDQLLALRDHRSGNIRESVCFLREFLARNPTTFSALEEVLKFIEFYEALGRNTTSLAFDPFLQLEEVYSGLVFRCLLASRQCIAIGGNYLLPLSQGEGCGISISLAAVAEFTPPNEASSFDSSTRVYVGSFGENMILERLRLVGELWKEGVCAGFSIDEDLNSSEQQTEAAVNGAQWLVTIREKSLPAPPVRIRNIEKKTDTEIPRSEVSKFFARPSRRR